MTLLSASVRSRMSVLFRVLAGTLGAYALTSVGIAALSLMLVRLGISRAEAVTGTTLASFAIFAVIVMSVFHMRSATRAYVWLLALGLPAALIVVVLS